MCWVSLDNPAASAESLWESTVSSHFVRGPWVIWPRAALFLKKNRTKFNLILELLIKTGILLSKK